MSSFVTKNLAVVLVDFVVRAFRFAITIKLAITSRTVETNASCCVHQAKSVFRIIVS